ncbi:hypothetical protein FOPG_12891 [Fusarium oxysporum f. sp. conglutinans race 2 54008]|uniref:2,3-bisphosphoglycerate-dependent phosphoglycerate mutase n=1 Tax=Fusarium oxysporum f. sp. conglutinans race 2 54008 TaxID=1089457 RepID=X0H5F3_FUSOX|nr:hypothetical protein FOPG_12891 [Fusarium oxysporum f. sp. conglutinans race 2 54008]
MTPSVFLVRHGQTEWSKVGKYTGKTDIELTDTGKKEALTLGDRFMGPNKLIDPSYLAHIFVSPRIRARETFELVAGNYPEIRQRATITEEFREWDHGDYEGMTTQQIRDLRAEKGLDTSSEWSIWAGGCEGGEYDYISFCLSIANSCFFFFQISRRHNPTRQRCDFCYSRHSKRLHR